ncbi:MAG TPA: HAD family phosphatase [Acidobacteriaceae bacterium]|jgi:HAD superfamily hydrolase (TIGR01509 family)
MVRQRKGLIFDFDGVVADTEPIYWKSWAELLGRHAISLSWTEYCRAGRGYRDSAMLDNLGITEPAVRSALVHSAAEHRERTRRWCAEESPISAATIEALRTLRGYRLGLVTSSERTAVEPLLTNAGIRDLFAACVYGDEITHAKPHPEPYLLICERLGIASGLAFEDSDAGMTSAAAAGLCPVRVNSPEDLPSLLQAALAGEWPA